MPRSLGFALFVLTLAVVAGCGSSAGSGIKVKGTLVNLGLPLQPLPKEEDSVDISFYPVDLKDTTKGGTAAVYNHADGAFEFTGQAGVGLVPGEYRIVVSYQPYEGDKGDLFKDQFSLFNSPLKYTITNEPEQHIVIDVGKKTVETKK